MRITVLLFLAVSLFGQEPPPPGAPKKGGPQPHKNLKILKDEEVRPAMAAFRTGLGVQCTACHVQGDFASDEKPQKNTARMMMTMVHDINAKFADGKEHVTCYTCHRGETMPKTVAPPTPPPAN